MPTCFVNGSTDEWASRDCPPRHARSHSGCPLLPTMHPKCPCPQSPLALPTAASKVARTSSRQDPRARLLRPVRTPNCALPRRARRFQVRHRPPDGRCLPGCGSEMGRKLRPSLGTAVGVSPHSDWVGPAHANSVNAAPSLVHHRGARRPPKALLQRSRSKLRKGGNDHSDHPGWSLELRRCESQDLGVHCSTAELLGPKAVPDRNGPPTESTSVPRGASVKRAEGDHDHRLGARHNDAQCVGQCVDGLAIIR
jgi:hypothetical protein